MKTEIKTQVDFVDTLSDITNLDFTQFFVGWKNRPEPDLKDIIQNSTYFVVAKVDGKAAGVVTSLSDKLISAYIPILEVLPEYKNQGIGTLLMQKILEKIGNLYMIDLICDVELNSFYEKFGFRSYNGCIVRNVSKTKQFQI